MGRIIKDRIVIKDNLTALPQSTSGNIFQVVGKVRIIALWAEVTTAFQAQANAVKFTHTPTGGSATDLCATVESNGAAVGRFVSVIGTTAATAAVLGAAGATPAMSTPWVLNEGIIKFSCAASSTGNAKYGCIWEPLENGSNVIPA